MLIDDPIATLATRRAVLCLLGLDLALIGLHVATSAAAMAGWVDGVPIAIRITRPDSLPELVNYGKWGLTVACLTAVFLRTRLAVFGSLAVIFALALLNDVFSFHASLGDRLAGVTGWDKTGELVAFAGFGALALGLLLPGLQGLAPGARGLAVRFVAVLAGLAAFGAVIDFANNFASPFGRLAGKSGSLVEEGGEMLLASLAAAYAVGAWRQARGGGRGGGRGGARLLGASGPGA